MLCHHCKRWTLVKFICIMEMVAIPGLKFLHHKVSQICCMLVLTHFFTQNLTCISQGHTSKRVQSNSTYWHILTTSTTWGQYLIYYTMSTCLTTHPTYTNKPLTFKACTWIIKWKLESICPTCQAYGHLKQQESVSDEELPNYTYQSQHGSVTYQKTYEHIRPPFSP